GGVVVEAVEFSVDDRARELVLVRRPAYHLDLEALGKGRQRAAAVGEDPVDVLVALGRAAEDQARDGAGGVGAELDRRFPDPLHQVYAAIGAGRMGVDRGLAAVEFLPYRRELREAEPFVAVARHHADAIGLERVEGIGDLLEAR